MRRELAVGHLGTVVLMDSITLIQPQDQGRVVVSASHGGLSSATYAVQVPLRLVVFNDAGVGKDGAGTVALHWLQGLGVPAACVAHTSARIGDAEDTWDNGVLSHLNGCAWLAGLVAGERLQTAVARWMAAQP